MAFDLIMQQIILSELKGYLVQSGEDPAEKLGKLDTLFERLILHGQLACNHDHTEKAIRSFEECLHLRGNSFRANIALGRIYMCQGKTGESEKYLRKAAQLRPNHVKARISWLYALSKLEQTTVVKKDPVDSIQEIVLKTGVTLGMSLDKTNNFWSLNNNSRLWARSCSRSERIDFEIHQYAILRNVLPDQCLELILRQQQDLMKRKIMAPQYNMKRYGIVDPPIAALINFQLCRLVANIIKKDVVPTYAFGIHYLPGGFIKPHCDRPQNELSMTLSLAVTPDGAPATLGVGEGKNAKLVDLGINDALLYRGCEVTHFRNPIPKGYAVDQMIFGFRTIDVSHCYCA